GTAVPSFTFSVAGEAHVLYATPSQVKAVSIVPVALSSLSTEQQLDACLAATGECDDYLNSSYVMPITAWGSSLVKHCGSLAVLQMMDARGWQPEGPDLRIVDNRDQAMTYLNRIAAGRLKPPDIVDSTPEVFEGGCFVVSGAPRGW
ncbi:MAG TPA: phage protein Gp36 family protein, partial [Polyangiaceae bacterium]|nr:phage protein Gp36 family protein [Polyangiaceae bacterium]